MKGCTPTIGSSQTMYKKTKQNKKQVDLGFDLGFAGGGGGRDVLLSMYGV